MNCESLADLQRSLQLQFQNEQLLKEAVTHRSYAAEWNLKYDNQRLEFLGDAVVQLVLTRYLYHLYPEAQEGDLTKIRSSLVNQDSLARFGRSIELGKYLLLGHGEIETHGADRDSTLSDAFEAFTGALYLDRGFEKAEEFLLKILEKNITDPREILGHLNPKGLLQEYTQSKMSKTPHYSVLSISGPPHEPVYEVAVYLGETLLATGKAGNRKGAEQQAAGSALEQLQKKEESDSV